MSTHLQQQIAKTTDRLTKLKARALLKQRAEEAKRRSIQRREDAHRKIVLGGLVIAAGVDGFDPAAIVGILLTHRHIPAGALDIFRERGIKHLQERDMARAAREAP